MTAAVRAEQAAGVYGAALIAIGSHIADHHLPVPLDIVRDQDGGMLICLVPGDSWRPWVASAAVLDETNGFHVSDPERLVTHWLLRLPDTGTVVRLRAARPAPLLVIGGGRS